MGKTLSLLPPRAFHTLLRKSSVLLPGLGGPQRWRIPIPARLPAKAFGPRSTREHPRDRPVSEMPTGMLHPGPSGQAGGSLLPLLRSSSPPISSGKRPVWGLSRSSSPDFHLPSCFSPEHPSPGTGRALPDDLVPSLPLAGRVKAAPYCRFSAPPSGGHGRARGVSGGDFSFIETGSCLFPLSCSGFGSFGFTRAVFRHLGAFPGGTGALGRRSALGALHPWPLGRTGGFLVGSGEGRPTALQPMFRLGWVACVPE